MLSISENISFPNIEKGGHYHTYKEEKFYVVQGKCQIKQRNIKNDDILDVVVEGKDEKIVEIIPNMIVKKIALWIKSSSFWSSFAPTYCATNILAPVANPNNAHAPSVGKIFQLPKMSAAIARYPYPE